MKNLKALLALEAVWKMKRVKIFHRASAMPVLTNMTNVIRFQPVFAQIDVMLINYKGNSSKDHC